MSVGLFRAEGGGLVELVEVGGGGRLVGIGKRCSENVGQDKRVCGLYVLSIW